MGLIRFVQAHNRNKELRKTRELEEQKLSVMEHGELNNVRDRLSSEDRRCPNCGRSIPLNARYCPFCSKKFW